jgi:cytochrome oxidase Cu insertion factor (SCO1/SenC/PrrC family)
MIQDILADCCIISANRSASRQPELHWGRFSIAVLVLTLGILSDAAFAQSQLPEAVRNVGIDQRLNQQLPLDIEFRNEEGRLVTLGEFFHDKPVVLSLVYHECPMLCNEVLEGMLRTFRVLRFDVGKEFEVLTVSFNPREDAASPDQPRSLISGASEGFRQAGIS